MRRSDGSYPNDDDDNEYSTRHGYVKSLDACAEICSNLFDQCVAFMYSGGCYVLKRDP